MASRAARRLLLAERPCRVEASGPGGRNCGAYQAGAMMISRLKQDRTSDTNRGSPHRPWSHGRSGARPKFKTVLSVTSNRDSRVL